jgi:hypothetical protein
LRIVRGGGVALGFEIKMMGKFYDWLVDSLPSGEKGNFMEWCFRVAAEGYPDLSIVKQVAWRKLRGEEGETKIELVHPNGAYRKANIELKLSNTHPSACSTFGAPYRGRKSGTAGRVSP